MRSGFPFRSLLCGEHRGAQRVGRALPLDGGAGGLPATALLFRLAALFRRVIDGQHGTAFRLVVCAEQPAILFIIPNEQTDGEGEAAEGHDQGDHLRDGHAAAEDELRVAQRLHDGAHGAVAEQVACKGEAARLLFEFPHQYKQQREDDEVEHALIKEEGVMPFARLFDEHGEGEPLQRLVGDFGAVYFLVDEVAPAADGLGEDDARHQAICHAEEIDLVDEAEQHHAQRTADDPADDGKAAVAEGGKPLCNVRRGVGEHEEGARADDAEGQDA